MSRIGRVPIPVPQGVQVEVNQNVSDCHGAEGNPHQASSILT